MLRPQHPILTVSMAPHVHCGKSIRGHMGETIIALMPAVIMAAMAFGMDAVRVMALSCAVAVTTEALCNRLAGRDPAVDDLSALLIGLLFACLLPASAPWWLVTVGSASAVGLGKAVFGGLGASPLCPPLVGWSICTLSWPKAMDTNATMLGTTLPDPLQLLKYFGADAVASLTPMSLFTGHQLGGLGAVHVAALLAGGIFLLIRRHIFWEIPAAFIIGLLTTAWIYQVLDPATHAAPLFHLLTGSTVLGAFFLATDPASSPIGRIPSLIYGLLAGIMVIIIRVYGIYPDGVPFAILLANLFTPLLDRIRPRPFGGPYILAQEKEDNATCAKHCG
ncbi:RnfABCDGE type electron transport complex subunit D [Pseudodesulfovibrio sp. F-1]|uniref:Ion-translocating oxidoreductase complex subunit D n=1 Tax=Pseudodesulfovibrio alkaliphilus TaxID=2661613 RepID=A0A7K1KLT1_9BACT|nr:RnfABCDGE type electron transport complex subunit D [Pseudodesulfovibrio alkaliphilus]MUM77038.1 RnfABCDGE type electron transport complex subunit D [Pseudodesulfovibrio alkaliphilus]